MNLSEMRKELDRINQLDMDLDTAATVWQIEEAWSRYNGKDLGQYRDVIEDRLHLAHSRRVRAGH